MSKAKRVLAIILVLALVLPMVPAFEITLPVFAAAEAGEGTCGGTSWTYRDGVLTIRPNPEVTTSSHGKLTTTYDITDALPWADYVSVIESVVIEEGVVNVPRHIFKKCSAMKSISIPSTVTTIDPSAFMYCSSLGSITISANNEVYEDENGSCIIQKSGKKLLLSTSGSVPSGIKEITANAFSYTISKIEENPTYYAKNIAELSIPASVTSIHADAFTGVILTDTISVASGNTKYYTEGNCLIEKESGKLLVGTNTSEIPSTVTAIAQKAFYKRSALQSVSIPSGVSVIEDGTFYGCTALATVNLPEGIEKIGDMAFKGCSSLEEIVIPSAVKVIGNHAFSACSALSNVKFSDTTSLESILPGAFADCTNLTAFVVPSSVTELGRGVFQGALGLTSLSVENGNAVYESADNCILSKDKKTLLIGCTGSAIPSYVTEIANYAFDGTGVSSVTIPEGVLKIGDYAFASMLNLTSVVVPESVSLIGDRAFFGCTNLSSVVLPENNVKLGAWMFAQCASLKTVTLPKDLSAIDPWLFANCSGLTHLIVPVSVTSIGEAAFLSCHALAYVVLPAGLETVGYGAFNYCTALKSVWYYGAEELPHPTVNAVNNSAFLQAETHLKRIDANSAFCDTVCDYCGESITPAEKHRYSSNCDETCNECDFVRSAPHSYRFDQSNQVASCVCDVSRPCTGITGECFYYLDGTHLTIFGAGRMQETYGGKFGDKDGHTDAPWFAAGVTSVVIEEGVTYISAKAFYGCEAITSIDLPTTVESVGSAPFRKCTALESIVIPEGWTVLPSNAFYGCRSLKTLYLPSTLTAVSSYATYSCTALTDVWYNGTAEQKAAITVSATDNDSLKGATWHYIDGYCDTTCATCGKTCEVLYETAPCDTHCDSCGGSLSATASHRHGGCEDSVCDNCFESLENIGHSYTVVDTENKFVACADCGAKRPYTGTTGDCFYYLDGATLIIFGTGMMKDTYGGTYTGSKPHTDAEWYAAWKDLETGASVVIEEGVTYISRNAFYGCETITSVTLPSTVSFPSEISSLSSSQTPGQAMFRKCTSLETVVIPNGWTSLPTAAFYGCTSLKSITLPAGITSIGTYVTYNCTSLTDVWYIGTTATKANISIASNNSWLSNATWHYISNYHDTTCSDCDAIREMTHAYSTACDTACNHCGALRTDHASHLYDGCNDIVCNVCYEKRETMAHTYDDDCDAICNVCSLTREVPHFYDSVCDEICNACGDERVAPHSFVSDCDSICDLCSAEFTRSDLHSYENDCDATCNACGYIREINHSYSSDCDTFCDVCEAGRTAEKDHVFTDCEDSECDACQESRIAPGHAFDNDCDDLCDACGLERDVTHIYDSFCDSKCNVCDLEREAPHSYTSDCDALCDLCAKERVTSAMHSYTDGCDGDCNLCGALRAAEHRFSSACDETCDDCEKTRVVSAEHAYDNNCDCICNDCGKLRPARHSYGASCETVCDICGSERTSLVSHSYTYDSANSLLVCEACGEEKAVSGKTGDCYYLLDGTKLTVFGNGAMGAGAPWGTKITSVTIASGVTSVGARAFYNCKDLAKVVLPASVTLIGEDAFKNCTALQNFVFLGTKEEKDAIEWKIASEDVEGTIDGNGTTIRPAPIYPDSENLPEETPADSATWDYVKVTGVNFLLDHSINANVHASVSAENFGSVVMRFTLNGNEVLVSPTSVGGDAYTFVFEGIAPQCMTDTIVAELLVDGEIYGTVTFSVRSYCDKFLSMSAFDLGISEEKYASAKTMMLSLLNYGATAQQYKSYKTSSLANAGLAEAEAEFEKIENTQLGSEWNKDLSDSVGEAYFKSANVWFDNENRLYFKFAAPEISETNFFVRVTDVDQGKSWDFFLSDFEVLGNDTYGIFTKGISVADFDHRFTVSLYTLAADHKGDRVENVIQTLSGYGINSYVYSMQNKVDASGNLTAMAYLARACYCYGVAANAYQLAK